MSDVQIPDTIVARVRKLLALAGNNSNEHEASAAAEKAQAILAEYNLSLAELGDGAPASEDSERVRDEFGLTAQQDWMVELMAALARNNFCKAWTNRRRATRPDGRGKVRERRFHVIIGRRANVATTIETYKYLVQAMERLCPFEDRRDRSNRSWFAGCVARLGSRLDERRREAEAASRQARDEPDRGDGHSLVLADVYSTEDDLNMDLAFGYPPGTHARRRMERDARQAEYRREREERNARINAREDLDEDMKMWMRAGYTETEAAEKIAEALRPESDAAREKRERAEQRWNDRYYRQQEREAAKVDQHAYAMGSDAGRDIGLDRQVRHQGRGKIA